MRTMCSREIFTKKCRQQQIFDSDLKGAWRYNHVTFTPIAKNFMSYCILIYMLSILCVRLTMKVKVGIPESFRGAWYPPKKLGRVTLIFLLYCASNDICFCNIVCMWLYWALWDMGSYFLVHLMDWISVSIVYSHQTYYELRMIHDRKSSRSVSCFARADGSLRKARFHSIPENQKFPSFSGS